MIQKIQTYQSENENNEESVKHPKGRAIASKVSDFDPDDKEYVQKLLCLSIQLEFTADADFSLISGNLNSQMDTYQFLCRVA